MTEPTPDMSRPSARITRKIEIDMGHRVPSHKGKCANMHGHRYVIEASFVGPLQGIGSEEGMVTDFGNIKALLIDVIEDKYDHKFCWYDYDPFVKPGVGDTPIVQPLKHGFVYLPVVPTAENLAEWWFGDIKSELYTYLGSDIELYSIKVYETPNCWAVYPADRP